MTIRNLVYSLGQLKKGAFLHEEMQTLFPKELFDLIYLLSMFLQPLFKGNNWGQGISPGFYEQECSPLAKN